ncbi:MAG: LysR family transcriptional regulator [Actinomycetota bacterium]|nr:LysR family transcriptional regulator [Actinomycetota bacterium]
MTARHGPVETGLGELAPRLRHFVAVGRSEHVTRAASALGVPQPTLSRSIARLEQDLGLRLFVRTGRALRLTREGRLLLEHAERALVELETGLRALAGDVSPDSGRLAFGFLHTLGGGAVPQLLREFRGDFPGVRFELVQRGHDALVELVRTGAVDLCLTSPLPEGADLEVRALHEQSLRLVVPAGHRLAPRGRLRLGEAAEETFVGLERGYGLRATSDEWCRRAGFVPRLSFEGEDIDTVRGLVAAGLGVALLPAHDVAGGAAGMVELEVVDPRPTRVVGLVWRRAALELPAVRAFRETVLRSAPRLLDDRRPRACGQDGEMVVQP